MYPNPTKENSLKIVISNYSVNLNIEIYNILGASVLKQKLKNNIKEINISTLKSGINLVKRQPETGSIGKKLVKN